MHKLPSGWTWVLFSNTTNGTPYFAGKDGGEEAFHLEGKFYVPVPVDEEAQEGALEAYSTTFETPDGPVKVEGNAAAVARKYKDGFESVRGELVKKANAGVEITSELAQSMLEEYRPYTGRRGVKTPTVEADRLEDLQDDPEALAAYLAERGITVS